MPAYNFFKGLMLFKLDNTSYKKEIQNIKKDLVKSKFLIFGTQSPVFSRDTHF